MGIRVECDWCREAIATGESYVTLAIDGKINREDVSGPARVFCGGRGGKNEQSCGSRLLALLNGNPGGRVDMGMEWQLVEVSGALESDQRHRHSTPRPVSADADLAEFLATISDGHQTRTRNALAKAGLATLDEIAAMSDDDLMAINGIGWTLRTKMRHFIAAREAAAGPNVEPTSPGDAVLYDELPHPNGRGTIFRVRRGFRKFLPNNLYPGYLSDAGISTVDDLRRACEDGSILEIPGVGHKTAARIADLIAQFTPVEGVPA
jgi:Helix-hairpin-helix domain